MALVLTISPLGHLFLETVPDPAGLTPLPLAAAERIAHAFAAGAGVGLLHLALAELPTPLPADLRFVRDFARAYVTRLCHTPGLEAAAEIPPLPAPPREDLAFQAMQAPPMRGLEYLTGDVLSGWWTQLDTALRAAVGSVAGGVAAYLRAKNPLWRLVGRVTFHLAENKRDPEHPFAFLATYAHRLSDQGRVQHLPLARALQEYAGPQHRGTQGQNEVQDGEA